MTEHCEEGATCVEGQCVSGMVCMPGEAICDEDGNAAQCNEVGTAFMEPESCDDGIPCTEDLCLDGTGCYHSPKDSLCGADEQCITAVCDPEDDEADQDGCVSKVAPECEDKGIADPQPASVVFPPTVPGDQITQKNVIIKNLGLGDLTIFGAEIQDEHKVFYIFFPPAKIETDVVFDQPIVVEPGKGTSLTVAFMPEQLGDFHGTLIVRTNDVTKPEGEISVPLFGEAVADNCIIAIPQELNFAGKEVGVTHTLDVQVKNCGDGLVPIYSLGLTPDSDTEYKIVASLTPPYDLDTGQSTAVTIGFTPSQPEQAYEAVLRIENGAPKMPVLDIPIFGQGIAGDATCPISVIDYLGGAVVSPYEPLALSGLSSFGLAGAIKTYLWDMEQPTGSHAKFVPGSTSSNVTVTPEICGEYVFKLNVWDDKGTSGCNTASQVALVLPEQDVYVELVWYTPGDPDELDEGQQKGADLDLHFVSPVAEGCDVNDDGEPDGWFDTPHDCYWGELDPNWGSPDPLVDDNPQMIADDSDGAGPEVVAINQPADGMYKVGVHYFSDHGFGKSYAKVRVYAHTGKAFESDYVELVDGDMWDVARVQVQGGGAQVSVDSMTDGKGKPDVVHDYTCELLPW